MSETEEDIFADHDESDAAQTRKRLQKVENLLARAKAREFEARDRQKSAEAALDRATSTLNEKHDVIVKGLQNEIAELRRTEEELRTKLDSSKGLPMKERALVHKIVIELGTILDSLDKLHSPHTSSLRSKYKKIASEMAKLFDR